MTIIYLKIAANADGTTAYVRLLGEGKDVQQSPLTPESGHVHCNSACPLCANSGHRTNLVRQPLELTQRRLVDLTGDI